MHRAAAIVRTVTARVAAQTPFNRSTQLVRNMSAAAAESVKQFALLYSYVPDVLEKRAPLRPAHLALAQEWKQSGKLAQGGAFVTEQPFGALFTFNVPSRADVESFVKLDPYVQAANPVVTDYQIREWTVVVGQPQQQQQASKDPNGGVAQVKAGDAFPKGVVLQETNPGTNVSLDSLLKGKKVILFGVPGAFTPGCSKTHLPGYIADAAKMRAQGIDEIICVSVNDAFVMSAWGEASGATAAGVRMLADTTADLTRKLGLALDLTAKLASVRSKRYSLLIEDGVVTQANVEPAEAPTGLSCSLASAIKLPKAAAGKL